MRHNGVRTQVLSYKKKNTATRQAITIHTHAHGNQMRPVAVQPLEHSAHWQAEH